MYAFRASEANILHLFHSEMFTCLSAFIYVCFSLCILASVPVFVCVHVFEWVLYVVVGVCKWWVCQRLCMVACHNTADIQAINLLTLWGQFDRGLMLSVTEWNLFIIPNVMVSSLRAFFSSLSVSVSLSLAFPSFLICSLVQFGNILLISFTYILPFRSRSSLIHVWFSCSASCPGPLAFIIHPPPFILSFGLSLHLLLSFFLFFHSLSLSLSVVHTFTTTFSPSLLNYPLFYLQYLREYHKTC